MPEDEETKSDGSFELAFLESVYHRDPDDPKVLTLLATLYTEMGEVEKGLALDRHHVELAPDDSSARYDYSCSLSLSGRLDEAFDELDKSIELGFDGYDWMARDPDLAPLRADVRWAAFLEKHHLPETTYPQDGELPEDETDQDKF